MSSSFEFSSVDRVTVGVVGEPGARAFFLQVRQDDQLVTLKVEKTQVAALAEYLGNVLRAGDRHLEELPGDLELEEPAVPEWVVGQLGVSYDEDDGEVLLVAEEAVAEGEEGAVARISASAEQMAALAIRGTSLVESGRPPCPLCGYPLDPKGHLCPRTNGHRPPRL